MNSIIQNLARVGDAVVREVSRFDQVTWCFIAFATVAFGYVMLRGNMIRST